jgi:hypothetical protein
MSKEETARALEKAWGELKAPQNETVTSKWYFKKGFEAATKAALGSRVVLPERMYGKPPTVFHLKGCDYENGFNDCLDQIKLLPLTAEQVDSLLPSYDDARDYLTELKKQKPHITGLEKGEAREAGLAVYFWLRESIKKRLGAV